MKRPHLSESDWAYYRQTWGFDPVAEARPSAGRYRNLDWKKGDPIEDLYFPGDYRYYAEFPLAADPSLHAAGVRVRASVEAFRGHVHNAIVFCRGTRRAEVACTHTVIYAGPAGEALTYAMDDWLEGPYGPDVAEILARAGGPVTLPPWEHFVALRSWVAAVAELGIGNALRATLPTGDIDGIAIPFGFNAAMQAQVMSAIQQVAPAAFRAFTRDFFLELADNVPAGWLCDHFPVMDARYGFSKALLADFETFQAVETHLDPRLWRDACAFMFTWPPKKVHALIRNRLDPNAVERGGRISTSQLLQWCREHPMSPISVFSDRYYMCADDLVLTAPDLLFLEEWQHPWGPPQVITCTPDEFEEDFPQTQWIINKFGWTHDYPRRRKRPPRANPRKDWEDLRIIFDVARRTNRPDFEQQMEPLDTWCNLRARVTQDPQVYRRLTLMTRTPRLALMAVLYPDTSAEILWDIRAHLREYDLGIEALAQISLKGKPDVPGTWVHSLPPNSPYCGVFLDLDEAIELLEVQTRILPTILLPGDIPWWYFSGLQVDHRFFYVEDSHVTDLFLLAGEWKDPRPITEAFPRLEDAGFVEFARGR